MTRCAIFIDGGYLSKLVLAYDRTLKPNIEKLCTFLSKDMDLVQAYYYTALPFRTIPPTEEEKKMYVKAKKFIDALGYMPKVEVKLGKMNTRTVQKGVDVMLAIDIVLMSRDKEIDKAVIITGDQDFVYAIEKAKQAGVTTQVWYAEGTASVKLLNAVDEHHILTQDILESCKMEWPKPAD